MTPPATGGPAPRRRRDAPHGALSSSSVSLQLAIGVSFAIAAALLRVLLIPLTGSGAPFLVFFGAVLVSSTVGGVISGLATAILGGAFATYLFIFHAGFSVAEVFFQYSLFLVEGASVGWVTGGFFASRRDAQVHLRALKISEERYQMALRATSDLIWDWRAGDDTLDFGDGLSNALGYSANDLHSSRRWWLERIHADDRERVDESLKVAFAAEQSLWAQEYRFSRADGSYIDVLDKGYVLYGREGRVKRMIGAMQNITQRRNDQRVLHEAEAKLRLITDALPALVSYLDQQGRHRFMNAEYERWFGRPRAEMTGRAVHEIIEDAETSQRIDESIAKVLKGHTIRFEESLTHAVRGRVPALFTFVPDFDENKSVRGFVTLVHDISEQKKTQRTLQESEEHYRLLAEVVPQIIFEARTDGQLAYVNSRWVRYSGLAQHALLGDGWAAAVHPDFRQQAMQRWKSAIAAGQDYETEILLRCALDGSYRWHLQRVLALRDDDGTIRKWIGCLVDIHERKKSEQELQALANYIPQLAWIADTHGDVYWLNQRWFDYSGKPFSQMAKKKWLTLIDPSHRDMVARELTVALGAGQAFEGTFPIANANGEKRWFLTRAIPIFDESGRLSRWFGTSTDINDQLETQNRLVSAQKDLQTAVQARDEFMSIASHELKTPLTSLQLVAQMAQRNLRSDPARACETPRVQKLVTQTEKSVERLTRLVDDMLDSSRIAMGKLSFKVEEFDLAELVAEVVDRMVPQVQASGGHVSITTRHTARGRWDRFRIEQVVINLLTNAMRYGAGSPIEIAVDSDLDSAWFSIRDHGPGIAKPHQERIFQQYERATPHSSISGLGLGLFICREIVARHGGSIALDSELGKGADFKVQLPRQGPSESAGVLAEA